jgi:PGF-pre-PGF domain-containing protein
MNIVKLFRTRSKIKFSSFISGFILIFLLAWTILPASAAEIEASRELSVRSVYPGESFAVTVHIKIDQNIEALTLNEDLPDGWQVSQQGNTVTAFQNSSTFKESTFEWIWTENLSAGEEKTIVYNVIVPSNSKPGNFTLSGKISAYSVPAALIDGSSEITVAFPPAEANFSANPLTGFSPLTVQFKDLSTISPDSWEWDFDGNGNIDSKEKNPIYRYENPGNYTVILKTTNSTYGNSTKTKIGYITVIETPSISETSKESDENGSGEESSSSSSSSSSSGGGSASSGRESASSGGGSSSSGGGGAAVSPESTKNLELKEISNVQIFKCTHTCFTFKGEKNEIVSVEFDPKKSFGKTTAIVEMLKNTSSIVKEPAPGTVYRNANIWIGNSGFSSSDNFENARINFRVNKSWVSENNINESSVTLYRYYQNSWNQLPTTLSGENEVYFHFTAETPGFSPFAISGTEKKIQSIEVSPAKTRENQTQNKVTMSDIEKQENMTSNLKNNENKSSPGFEGAFTIVELLALYNILKKKR